MYTKKNTRVTFRSTRRPNFKRSSNFSNNKPKNKGNVTQQYNKYLKLAKEISSTGDRVQSEYYYQFTDHYYRLMVELGITFDDNENQEDKSEEIQTSNTEESIVDEEKKETIKDVGENKSLNESENNDIESIESIPFISKPAKKKSPRIKKVSA